jgi:hypothetical protein
MLKLANSGEEQKPPDVPLLRLSGHTISPRSFLIMLSASAATAWVWHRTGGDFQVTAAFGVSACGALDRWIRK